MKPIFITILLFYTAAIHLHAQVIARWDFNSKVPDNTASTGDTLASAGSGNFSRLGRVAWSITTGANNNGSSDPSSDNSALNTSSFGSQGTNNRQNGWLIEASAAGMRNIRLSFDIRHSASSSKYIYIEQYAEGNWEQVGIHTAKAGADRWYHQVTFGLIPQEDTLILVRMVTGFAPDTNVYLPAGSSSYSAGGTIRLDMITLEGDPLFTPDTSPPLLLGHRILSKSLIELQFNEKLSFPSALDPGNFGFVEHLERVEQAGDSTLQLFFEPSFTQGRPQTLKISNISDVAGNVIESPAVLSFFYNASRPPLMITEIMYNDTGADALEYIELYNSGPDTIYLGGFYIAGLDFRFDSLSCMRPYSYHILAKDAQQMQKVFGTAAVEWKNGQVLSNTGECLAITNMDGDTIDFVCYSYQAGWPKESNGKGPSLELTAVNKDNGLAASWRASFSPASPGSPICGSPGYGYAGNTIEIGTDTLRASEKDGIVAIPLRGNVFQPPTVLWVELTNARSDSSVVLTNPHVRIDDLLRDSVRVALHDDKVRRGDQNFQLIIRDINNGSINRRQCTIIITDDEPTAPQVTSCKALDRRTIRLSFNEPIDSAIAREHFQGIRNLASARPDVKDPSGRSILLRFSPEFPQGKVNYLLVKDLSDREGHRMHDTIIPVFYNATRPELLITEVMYNPPGDDDLEYIELYNPSNDTFLLGGFYVTGIAHTFNIGEFLAPGTYYLLAGRAAETEAAFGIPFASWETGSLSNNGECLEIFNMDSISIARLCYDDANGWPKEADGKGSSLELRQSCPDYNEPSSWRSSFTPTRLSGIKGTPDMGFGPHKLSFTRSQLTAAEENGILQIPVFSKKPYPNMFYKARLLSGTALADEDVILEQPVYAYKSGRDNYVEVKIIDDALFEKNEHFTVELTDLNDGKIEGFPAVEVLLRDNDHIAPELCINELMVKNEAVAGPQGKRLPFVEIYNPNSYAVPLWGHHLRFAGPDSIFLFVSDSAVLPPFAYHAVWITEEYMAAASSKNIFARGRLELIAPDGITILNAIDFDQRDPERSVGRAMPCEGEALVLFTATPGYSNSPDDLEDRHLQRHDLAELLMHPLPCRMMIYDGEGKLVRTREKACRPDLEGLSPGVYLLCLETGTCFKYCAVR